MTIDASHGPNIASLGSRFLKEIASQYLDGEHLPSKQADFLLDVRNRAVLMVERMLSSLRYSK